MTASIEQGYEGINRVDVERANGQMEQLGDQLEEQVEGILAEA